MHEFQMTNPSSDVVDILLANDDASVLLAGHG